MRDHWANPTFQPEHLQHHYFFAVGWGTMICFTSIMCVLNAWRLAPLKQNKKIGNERQPAFSSEKPQNKI